MIHAEIRIGDSVRLRDRRGRRRGRRAGVGQWQGHGDHGAQHPQRRRALEASRRSRVRDHLPAGRSVLRRPRRTAPRPVWSSVDAQHPHRGRRPGRDGTPDGRDDERARARRSPTVAPDHPATRPLRPDQHPVPLALREVVETPHRRQPDLGAQVQYTAHPRRTRPRARRTDRRSARREAGRAARESRQRTSCSVSCHSSSERSGGMCTSEVRRARRTRSADSSRPR